MATMVPDEPPITDGGSERSENLLYEELESQLPDDFVVYHGLPYLTHSGRQGEVDFLIFHPEHGLLNLECKGSGVHRRPSGKWYRNQPGGAPQKMRRTPTEQARDQIESIVELLAPRIEKVNGYFPGKFPVLYAWALAFPKTRRSGINPPTSLHDELLVDAQDLSNLHDKILEAYAFHARKMKGSPKSLSREEFDNIRFGVLQQAVDLGANLGGEIENERRRFVELSERQLELARSMMVNRRLAVSGGAGTGKTLMAMHGARLMAEEGKDVLVTCFNAALAEHLRQARRRWPEVAGEVHIDNFHSICGEVNDARGIDLHIPPRDAPQEEQNSFWAETFTLPFFEALDSGDYERAPWDAIIVDEAQDFYHEWWDILEAGLREDGKLIAFHDQRQSLFDHGCEVPDFPAQFRLQQNYRNTKEICRKVGELTDVELRPHDDCPVGEPPVVYQQPGPTKTRRKVGEFLDKLVDRENVEPAEIAILTPHRPENSALEGATELGGQPIVHETDEWFAGEGILHTTIAAFKGMEAAVVILVDVDPDDERCGVNARYVAASRAKHRLHVYENGHWLTT
jgi:hypothetical protein